MTCPNHGNFRLLTVAKRGSCGPTKGVGLALHPVTGFVLKVGGVEKLPLALGFEGPDPFFRVSKQGPCFTATEEDRGDKRLIQSLNLLAKLMVLQRQIL